MNTKLLRLPAPKFIYSGLTVITAALALNFLNAVAPVELLNLPTLSAANRALAQDVEQDVNVRVYQSASPAVVSIEAGDGSGSGIIIDADGLILTNAHVVSGFRTVKVILPNGAKLEGEVIAFGESDVDLAAVRVRGQRNLPTIPLAAPDSVAVGQRAFAIGNPFGQFQGTFTTGIVSRIDPDRGLIQTDTAINPGNSGGPLFNINGEVIGINRAIRTTNFTETGEPINSGIGFAISVNIIKRVVPVLIETGEYNYPYLGVSSISTLTLDALNALGLKQYTGAYVTNVVPGGPADKAGLTAGDTPTSYADLFAGGDLIIAIDGRDVRTFDEMLAYLITNKSPGDTVVLTVLRGEEKVDLTITLGERP
ncbi:MAG: trypsin-like peptidase domain-containing protein [Anaerolineae bacterium]|nr:trypsin-like peptidase domain-containing protein [Anaerolineae bacterium]